MEKLQKLIEQRNKLDIEISNLEYKRIIEVSVPLLKKSIGKCFKYRNSYGGDRPQWYLYTKIVGVDEKNMSFNCVSFQKTSMDIVEIKFDQKFNFRGENYFNDRSYIEIKASEYNRAKNSIQKLVTKILD